MNNKLAQLKMPLFVSIFLVLPFVILELVNRRQFHEAFPFPLFGFMGLQALIFGFGLTALLRQLRTGAKGPGAIFVRVLLLVIIGVSVWSLTTLLIDQWPCFLGVPNCD
ncbi:hypothetical protein EG834_20410 [bacterium]|nr:hypothetical protein [bacterium]